MDNQFFELMQEHNPFLLKDEKKKVMMFNDYGDAYCELLSRLYEQAPRGYIDLVLFLTTNQDMPLKYAEQFMEHFVDCGALKPELRVEAMVIVNWKDMEGQMRILESLMIGFHWLTETTFNKAHFLHGITKFKIKNQLA